MMPSQVSVSGCSPLGKRHNQTDFKDGEKTVIFAGDFNMARLINEAGRDVQLIFVDLSNGLMPAEDIRNVMIAGLVSVDGTVLVDSEIEPYVEYLISTYGLQECSVVARLLLSHALIGDKKKIANLKGGGSQRGDNEPTAFPVEEFAACWVIFGGDIFDFGRACMRDFQILREAFLAANGIVEENDTPETTEDLDELYAAAAKWIKKEKRNGP